MKKHRPLPPIELLRERYEIAGNDLVWKKVTRYGDRKIGGLVGNVFLTGPGKRYRYCRVTVATGKYVSYLVHRIAYAIAYGVDPGEYEVDHIDGDTLNNSAGNLRLATRQQNRRNRHSISMRTMTGIRGVHVSESKARPYVAHIKINDKAVHLGRFATVEEAAEFVKVKRREVFGDFAGADVLTLREAE